MLSTFISSLIGKLLVGTVALATTTGGLAATGNLPDAAQDWASEQLSSVGIQIPDSDHEADGTAGDVLRVIEEGNPEDGEEFGHDVADTASDEKSSDGLDKADDNAGVADEYTNNRAGTPDETDEGTDNADQAGLPDEADEGTDNADNANNPRP